MIKSECIVCLFFKQKTAYEMRISDWSSDVCSSDLDHHRGLRTSLSTPSAATALTFIRDTGAVTRHGLTQTRSRADPHLEADPLAAVLHISGHPNTTIGMSAFRRTPLRPHSRRSAHRCVRVWAASVSPRPRSKPLSP